MDASSSSRQLDELLTPPRFSRDKWKAHLYAPYSRKLSRRVYVYTHSGYDLWVLLESDPEVTRYNERPPAVPVVLRGNKAINASPAAISVSREGIVSVHTLNDTELRAGAEQPQESLSTWEAWAQAQGFHHQEWSPALLRRRPVWLSNVKILLRYVCYPDYIPSQPIEHAVLSALKERRRITFAALAYLLECHGRDIVEATMAALILDRRIFSDIDRYPFSQTTELSAYHEIT